MSPRIMSRILLTDHSENIYNIVQKEDAKPPPKVSAKPTFISKFVKADIKGNKYSHKTFGFADIPLNKPSEYLKKNSRILPSCPKTDEPRCLLSHRLPKIPPRIQAAKKQKHDMARHTDEQALEDKEEGMEAKHDVKQNEHSLKDKRKNGHNYCYQNIEKAKKLVPCQPTRNYVDTKRGDTHVLQSSGMETHYVLKKAFGKIPNYLHHRQLHVQASKKKIQEEIKQLKPEGHYITQSQRKALLQGLKHNWEELQKTYQQLPIITDTIPKKKYKIKLEEELKQLESDIKTIERHKHIYVTDADSSEFSYNLDSE